MDWVTLIVGLLLVLLGGAVGWLLAHARSSSTIAELSTKLEFERGTNAEKLANMKESFGALSSNALRENNDAFISLAKASFGEFEKPIKETLKRFDDNLLDLERRRVDAYAGLRAQVTSLVETQEKLRTETANLVNALRTPHIRGRWGEIQLRRVVEIADMVNHCDFLEQQSVTTEEGRQLRPDMIINLPGGRNIVVDAKTPLEAYLRALESDDEGNRQSNLKVFAEQIRTHVAALSSKSYWNQFQPAPEFVFMFIPGESFFSAALQVEPSLIEEGVQQRVIIATPITLITLLKAVAYGWKQEQLAKDAQKIGQLGKDLYDRICTMGSHFSDVGDSLKRAVEKYNQAVGSLESRVLSKAREFKNLPIDGSDHEISDLVQVDAAPRLIQAAELSTTADLEKTLPS
jgi:DNA recombination protein RmuC